MVSPLGVISSIRPFAFQAKALHFHYKPLILGVRDMPQIRNQVHAFRLLADSNIAASDRLSWSWYAWQDSNLRPFAPEARAPFPFLSLIAFFSIVLHEFGDSAFAQGRTPFPPITYTFGTLLAHTKSNRRRPDSYVDRPGVTSFTLFQSELPSNSQMRWIASRCLSLRLVRPRTTIDPASVSDLAASLKPVVHH